MNIFRLRRIFVLSALLAVPFVGPSARASYITQTVTLDQSNTFKDGVNYGTVTIQAYDGVGAPGGGLSAGQVKLTYFASSAPYTSLDKTFGIDRVAFNTDLSLSAGQITGAGTWKVKSSSTVADFGKFSWDVQGNASGGTRPNPVTILISGLGANATPDHFLIGSVGNGNSPPTQGSVFFAMHVAGFTMSTGKDLGADSSSDGGHFVGGSALVQDPTGSGEVPVGTPEPASLALAGLGLGAFGLVQGIRKFRRRSKTPTSRS